jgi:hypothetical protein
MVIAVGSIIDDYNIGLPMSCNLEDANDFTWTEWISENHMHERYGLLIYTPCAWMHNHVYKEAIHEEYAILNDAVYISLEEITKVCRWLIYYGREYDNPKNASHIKYRISEPEFPSIMQCLLGDYEECDNIERAIIDDAYPRIM